MRNNIAFLTALVLSVSYFFGNAFAAQDDYYEELRAISFVESSGGRNLNHKTLDRGIHKGTHAGGYFGIMPLTAKFVISRSAYLRKKYGAWLARSNDEITNQLNQNRQMDYEIAVIHWRHLRSLFNDPSVAAYAWNHGWGTVAGDDSEEIQADVYVERFKEFYEKLVKKEDVDSNGDETTGS